jgi:transglutaminase-like putative cysteine protease
MNPHRSIVLAAIGILALLPSARAQVASDEPQRLFEQAQGLAKSEKFDEAVVVMQKVLRLAPRNDRYLATASHYELKAGKFTDGLEHAVEAIRLNDKVGTYYVLAAANAYGDQDIEKARSYCERVLKYAKEFGEGPCNDARIVQDLLVPKTYTLYWNLDPQKGRLVSGTFAVALPKGNLPYQSVTYDVKDARGQRLVKGDVNDVLYITPQGTKPFTLTTKVTVRPYSFKKELAKADPMPLPEEARASLGPADMLDPKSPALKKVVANLKAGNNVDTARNILTWMKKNIEYKLGNTPIEEPDFKTVDEVLERRSGECRGYALLFVALCRAAGVPARPVWGLARVQPGQDQRFGGIASHNWAEVYVPGAGWVPVDPQRPETLGFLPTSDIRIFMDVRKSKTSTETLPMLNLVYMNGGKLKFDEAR